MELAYRKGMDAFVPAGSYRRLEANLREHADALSEMPAVVVSCNDPSTRMLPFVLYDKMIFPCGARAIAGALRQAGFERTRAVFQLWNPNFRPSHARIDGRPIQLLLLSTMQIHTARAHAAIRDAWTMGEGRPLIIVGGPKAVHEPYGFWPLPGADGEPIGPDVVVTGEAYVLLDLLRVLLGFHRKGEPLRNAFERAALASALDDVPGLVYRDPTSTLREPVLIDTGLQRLVQHLDEMPHEVSSLSILEPPHRGYGLSPSPIPDKRVRHHATIVSLLVTQGCKFNCSYCPIPGINQKTWRFRSPEGLAHEFASVRDRFGVKYYFGTDDNFLNRRETAEDFFQELARARTARGKRLGHQIRWSTEATQFDTYKNRDLLPLAREAGLFAIWFGIEDLTAELVNKGQKPEVTTELFKLMHAARICPMAMMMFHDGQPFHTRKSLYGLRNQVEFLRKAGAISVQITQHIPAVGTREFEKTFRSGKVIRALGSYEIPDSKFEGNHLLVGGTVPAWKRQLQWLGGYFTFYNPLNALRALRKDGTPLRWYRFGYQAVGLLGALRTAWKTLPYALRLIVSKPTYHADPPPITKVPVREVPGSFSRFPAGTKAELTAPPARKAA
jgi:radical SAM superfamily enzyme YgiQ (UPF0313 family)